MELSAIRDAQVGSAGACLRMRVRESVVTERASVDATAGWECPRTQCKRHQTCSASRGRLDEPSGVLGRHGPGSATTRSASSRHAGRANVSCKAVKGYSTLTRAPGVRRAMFPHGPLWAACSRDDRTNRARESNTPTMSTLDGEGGACLVSDYRSEFGAVYVFTRTRSSMGTAKAWRSIRLVTSVPVLMTPDLPPLVATRAGCKNTDALEPGASPTLVAEPVRGCLRRLICLLRPRAVTTQILGGHTCNRVGSSTSACLSTCDPTINGICDVSMPLFGAGSAFLLFGGCSGIKMQGGPGSTNVAQQSDQNTRNPSIWTSLATSRTPHSENGSLVAWTQIARGPNLRVRAPMEMPTPEKLSRRRPEA